MYIYEKNSKADGEDEEKVITWFGRLFHNWQADTEKDDWNEVVQANGTLTWVGVMNMGIKDDLSTSLRCSCVLFDIAIPTSFRNYL